MIVQHKEKKKKKKKKAFTKHDLCEGEIYFRKHRHRINKQGWDTEHCLWLIEETPFLHMTPGLYRNSEHLQKTFI